MMKKNISYIPMDHALEIWLLEKLLREPPESAYTKELISGIQDMISGEVSSLLLGALQNVTGMYNLCVMKCGAGF